MAIFYSASQAAARLGVSRQPLYSYVSRRLLRAHPGDSHREHRYLIAEVNQLATWRSRARNPVRAARNALNWGLPVVESSISTIDGDYLYCRGKNVLSLIETHSAEDVAALFWQRPKNEALAAIAALSAKDQAGRPDPNSAKFLVSSFAIAGRDLAADSWQAVTGPCARPYGDRVRVLASCVLQAPPATESLRQQCARACKIAPKKSTAR